MRGPVHFCISRRYTRSKPGPRFPQEAPPQFIFAAGRPRGFDQSEEMHLWRTFSQVPRPHSFERWHRTSGFESGRYDFFPTAHHKAGPAMIFGHGELLQKVRSPFSPGTVSSPCSYRCGRQVEGDPVVRAVWCCI